MVTFKLVKEREDLERLFEAAEDSAFAHMVCTPQAPHHPTLELLEKFAEDERWDVSALYNEDGSVNFFAVTTPEGEFKWLVLCNENEDTLEGLWIVADELKKRWDLVRWWGSVGNDRVREVVRAAFAKYGDEPEIAGDLVEYNEDK